MRLLPLLLAITLTASLAACQSNVSKPWKTYSGAAELRAAAEAGDANAAYFLGDDYCTDEPAGDHGRETVKWLTRGTKANDLQMRLWAEQELGNFYLARFNYRQFSFNPNKDAGEKRYCTGSRRSAQNDVLAEKHLRACSAAHFIGANYCDENLGKLYIQKKKYAEAYEVFSYTAAWHEDSTFDYGTYYNGPLSSLPSDKNAMMFDDWKLVKPYMQQAAKHLTAQQRARYDAQARTYVRRENARYWGMEARKKLNK